MQRDLCWPAAQLAAAQRLYDLLHRDAPFHDGTFTRWAKSPSTTYPFHYSDGVNLRLTETDERPGDDFLTNVRAQPYRPGDQQPATPDVPDVPDVRPESP